MWPEILTLAEAAKFYRVSERTMWQKVQEDEIPYFKIGSQYRFHLSELRRIATAQTQEETSK